MTAMGAIRAFSSGLKGSEPFTVPVIADADADAVGLSTRSTPQATRTLAFTVKGAALP